MRKEINDNIHKIIVLPLCYASELLARGGKQAKLLFK